MTHFQGLGVRLVGILVIFSLILMACQDQENNETQTPPQNSGPIDVVFKTDPPSDLPVGQPVELQAEVTRMGNVITDAEEVMFEVWEKKDEYHIEGSEQHVTVKLN